LLFGLLGAAPAQGQAPGFTNGIFTEFTGGVAPGFSANGGPSGAALGPDGNVWFAAQANPGRIAKVTPAGAVTELTGGVTPSLAPNASPANLVTGPDGNVWVTGFGDPGRIWKVTPAGVVTEVATGGQTPGFSFNRQPTGITVGPDGNLWFVEIGSPGIVAKITTSGVVTEVATGGQTAGFSANGQPRGIARGPDGNLWVTEFAAPGRIARITPAGVVSEFTGGVTPGFSSNGGPLDIKAGPDGNLWFTEQSSPGRIGRITPAGVVTEFSGFTADRQPTLITTGPDGNLWFSEQANPGGVARIKTTGEVTEFPAGITPGFTANRAPTGIAPGGDGNVWFTELNDPGAITRIAADAPRPATPGPSDPTGGPPSPVAGPTVTSLTASAPIVSGRPALLSAQVAGSVQRLEWDVTGDGKTDVSCGGDQTTLTFRPSPGGSIATSHAAAARFTGVVSVRAVGVGGTGPVLSQTLAVSPGPAIAGHAKLVSQVAAVLGRVPPVYACGLERDLTAASDELSLSASAALRDAYCLRRTIVAGTLLAEGCFKPIRKLDDIPTAERGIVLSLARLLRFPVEEGKINATLGPALSLSDAWIAVGSILVNGVEFEPQGGARVVFYPQVNQIVSSDAAMSVGGIKLANRRDFSLDTRPTAGGVIPVGQFRRVASSITRLGDFALTGDVGVVLKPGTAGAPAGAEITTTLELPSFLDVGGGAGQAKVRLGVAADGQLVLDGMHIGPLTAGIGSLEATDLQFDYRGAARGWEGQANLCPEACLQAKQEDALKRQGRELAAEIGIRNRQLRAGVNLTFPRPGFPLFSPTVSLNRINASLGMDPARLLGSASVTALGIYEISGSLALAFPTAAAPFRLSREELGNSFPTEFYGAATSHFTVAAAGDASLTVPVVGAVHLGGAYFFYQATGNVRLGGDIDTSFLGIVRLRGRTNGEFILAHGGHFNFGQDIEACIFDFICHNAHTRLSSVGVGGCYTLGPVSFGGGVRFSPFEPIIWPIDGCKWSRFEDSPSASARAAQAGRPLMVTVKRGDPSRAIRLDGSEGAPRVRVTAPGGQVLESPEGAGTQLTPSIRILRSEQLKATVVGLQDPRPGDYAIETMPASPAITKVSTAEDPPGARVTASVHGRGARRTLLYDVLPRPGQRVTFVETGPGGDRLIGTVSGGRGTLSFAPAPGPSPRRVEAQFELAGIGAETRTVASFTPPSTRLGRPARVLVRRRRATLRVSFQAVAGASWYDVVSTLTNGDQQIIHTRRRSVTIRRVTPSSGGRVSVRGVASMRQGAARTTRFRATAPRAPTRIGPLPRLKRRP
jgi:streptogramin lyase